MQSKLSMAIMAAIGGWGLPSQFMINDTAHERKSTVASRGRHVDIDDTGKFMTRPRNRVGPLNAKKAKMLRHHASMHTLCQPACVYVLEERVRKMPTIRLRAGCTRDVYKAMKNGLFV